MIVWNSLSRARGCGEYSKFYFNVILTDTWLQNKYVILFFGAVLTYPDSFAFTEERGIGASTLT